MTQYIISAGSVLHFREAKSTTYALWHGHTELKKLNTDENPKIFSLPSTKQQN